MFLDTGSAYVSYAVIPTTAFANVAMPCGGSIVASLYLSKDFFYTLEIGKRIILLKHLQSNLAVLFVTTKQEVVPVPCILDRVASNIVFGEYPTQPVNKQVYYLWSHLSS